MPATHKRNLLAVVPPYSTWIPPLGTARLMGHLKKAGCDEFDFIDFRLWTSDAYAPTFRPVGTYGETYVVDVPDLPLVLKVIDAFDCGKALNWEPDSILETYALDRGIHFRYLSRYLAQLDRFLAASIGNLSEVDFIGLSTWSSNFLPTLMAASHLKKRRNPPFVVLGGPAVSLSRNCALLALRSGLADAVVVGEGEDALLALYEAFRRDAGAGSVPGVLTLDASTRQPRYTERPLMRLAEQGLPDFSCMPIMSYQTHGYPLTILPFEISRGCTDKCTFCSEWVLWRRFRHAGTDLVVDQIEELARRYNAQGIWFRDSLMNGVKGRFIEFCDILLARETKIKWMGYARADFDQATARLAREAGMETTYVGIESMDDTTLELMNKRRTAEDNLTSLRALLDAGIRVRAGFIPGFPGTTREAVRRTAGVLGRLQSEYRGRLTVNAEPFTPYAGQPILDSLDQYGLEPHVWPEEVLDIAPAYRDITGRIIEKVTGASQGLERLGMQREVTVISSGGEGPEGEAEGDVFVTRASFEDLHDRRLAFEDLGDGLWLARFKSDDAVRESLIYTSAEKKDYERAMLFDTRGEAMRRHTAKVRRRHLAGMTPESGVMLPAAIGPASGDAGELVLCPFAVVRELDDAILVIDRFSKHRVRLGRGWKPALEALARGARRADLLMSTAFDGEAETKIDEMCSRGLLARVPSHAATQPSGQKALPVLRVLSI